MLKKANLLMHHALLIGRIFGTPIAHQLKGSQQIEALNLVRGKTLQYREGSALMYSLKPR
jgi:hypothetical protein